MTHMRINHLKDRIISLRNMPGRSAGKGQLSIPLEDCTFLKPNTERVKETGEARRSLILRIDRDDMHCGCLESSIHTALRFEIQIAAALPGQERHEREPHIENNPDRTS